MDAPFAGAVAPVADRFSSCIASTCAFSGVSGPSSTVTSALPTLCSRKRIVPPTPLIAYAAVNC